MHEAEEGQHCAGCGERRGLDEFAVDDEDADGSQHEAGQDRASALLYVYLPATGWKVYRLPKSTHTQDHAWTTEWPRIREVESERWLMDASGMFYELPAMTYGDAVWGIVPVCRHLRIIGDYCSWNGLLVLAGVWLAERSG